MNGIDEIKKYMEEHNIDPKEVGKNPWALLMIFMIFATENGYFDAEND